MKWKILIIRIYAILIALTLLNCNGNEDFVSYYSNGRVSKECTGSKDSLFCIEYFENGQRKTEYYLNESKRNGTLVKYDSGSTRTRRYLYENDTLNGYFDESIHGEVVRSGYYKNGEKCGYFDIFGSDSEILERREYAKSVKGILVNQRLVYKNSILVKSDSYYFNIVKDTLEGQMDFFMDSFFKNSTRNILVLGNYSDETIESFVPSDTIELNNGSVTLNSNEINHLGGIFVDISIDEKKELPVFKEMFFRFDNKCLSNNHFDLP